MQIELDITQQQLETAKEVIAALESWLLMGRESAEDQLDAQAFAGAHASALETFRLLTNVTPSF